MLKNNGVIIIFKKHKAPYINVSILNDRTFNHMEIHSVYSILPFYSDNPLFFLPIHKTIFIKHSLNIIISIIQTISPEVKKTYGKKYLIVLFILKQLLKYNLHVIMRIFCFGTVTILKNNE